jgi:hypothetical protein
MALTLDKATLEAALVGYQHQMQLIEAKIAEVRKALRQTPEPATAAKPATKKTAAKKKARHKMSEEGRARISAAQRARWAKLKKTKG